MRTQVKKVSLDTALMRILDALAEEAIESSDEEVREAARDLRMDLDSRESAAFAGLTYFARPQLSDFFECPSERPRITSAGKPTRRK